MHVREIKMGCRGGDRDGSNTRRRDERQAQLDRKCSVNGPGRTGKYAFPLDTAPSVILVQEMRREVGDKFGHGTKCNVPLGECYY